MNTIREELMQSAMFAGKDPDEPVTIRVSEPVTIDGATKHIERDRFVVPFHEVAAMDTVTWRGWYVSLARISDIVRKRHYAFDAWAGVAKA